jgi:hypothetical protein
MKAIWVLENFKERFLISKIELRIFLTSVVQWKRFYPQSETVLFCTDDVHEYLRSLEADALWDRIDSETLKTSDGVDRQRFWTAGKYKVMKGLETPFVLMDCDLFLIEKIDESVFEHDLVVCHPEDAEFYHHIWQREEVWDRVGIERLPEDPEGKAWNVSFFYLKNQSFKGLYLETAWSWMEKLSTYRGEEQWQDGYMLYCEQKLLYDLSVKSGVKTYCLKGGISGENPVHLGEEKRREDLKKTHLPFREYQAQEAIKGSGLEEKVEKILANWKH